MTVKRNAPGARRAYTDSELELMMADLESELVERKGSLRRAPPGKDGPVERIRQAVCAFANDLPGHNRPGVVFVGVRDDGRPSGATVTDRVLQRLADIKTDGHIVPPPTMTVEPRTLAGSDVGVVTVQPSDAPPVRARGQIWIRVGSRRAIATAQDERILNERRRHRDAPFDLRPIPGATLADLHIRRFEEDYLPEAVDADTLRANDRTTEQQLAAARMIASVDDPVPTVTGMLIFGRSPQNFLPGAYVQFLRIGGAELSAPILDESRCTGHVARQIEQLILKLDSHNRTSVDITSGPVEVRASIHAPAALRQVAYNAVMHRTYEGTNTPVRVTWFDDRVEFMSPGEPYGSVTPENLGRPGVADYRNPSLAGSMRVLGIVQRFGVGLAIARDALRANRQPDPDFEVLPNYVRCTIWARPLAGGG